jgi:hypothetical protein
VRAARLRASQPGREPGRPRSSSVPLREAIAHRADIGLPDVVRSLQQTIGNAAVGRLLGRPPTPPATLIQRAPSVNSMDSAWGEFTVQVAEANVFSFIVRLHKNKSLPDGGKGFTWSDFLTVIGSSEGKNWVKKKWRDTAGDKWGDQEIQGQHEWIKTDDVNYVIRTVVISHGGANLDAWLAACEMLRIPTADVAFNPEISPQTIEDANQNPGNYSANTLGQFSGHVGAFYELRTPPHPKDPVRYANRPLTKHEKKDFHTPLHQLLLTYLSNSKNDLEGFLNALKGFQSQKVWGGDIPNLNTADQIQNDFFARQTQGAPLRGRYTPTYQEGVGITTNFEPAQTVADLQGFAREAKVRNERMMEQRINALVRQWHAANVPQPLSNFRHVSPTEPAFTVDKTGKSVEDYDREAGYDASKLSPNAYGGDVEIPEDTEPDEEYTPAPIHPSPQAPTQTHPMPKAVLDQYGQARSSLTHQLEQRLQTINTEVQRLFTDAYQAEIKELEHKVTQALSQPGANASQPAPDKNEILKAAVTERENINRKYNDEGRRQYDTYIAKKQKLDRELYAQETRETTTAGLQTLLETYYKQTDALLDAYVADIKLVLKI